MMNFERPANEFSFPSSLNLNAVALDWVGDVSASVLRCVDRHFAVASAEIARDGGVSPEESARYSALSARFRALIEDGQGLRAGTFEAGPVVPAGEGRSIPLVAIFIDACREYRLPLPSRSIDPSLVHEAKALLRGVPWELP